MSYLLPSKASRNGNSTSYYLISPRNMEQFKTKISRSASRVDQLQSQVQDTKLELLKRLSNYQYKLNKLNFQKNKYYERLMSIGNRQKLIDPNMIDLTLETAKHDNKKIETWEITNSIQTLHSRYEKILFELNLELKSLHQMKVLDVKKENLELSNRLFKKFIEFHQEFYQSLKDREDELVDQSEQLDEQIDNKNNDIAAINAKFSEFSRKIDNYHEFIDTPIDNLSYEETLAEIAESDIESLQSTIDSLETTDLDDDPGEEDENISDVHALEDENEQRIQALEKKRAYLTSALPYLSIKYRKSIRTIVSTDTIEKVKFDPSIFDKSKKPQTSSIVPETDHLEFDSSEEQIKKAEVALDSVTQLKKRSQAILDGMDDISDSISQFEIHKAQTVRNFHSKMDHLKELKAKYADIQQLSIQVTEKDSKVELIRQEQANVEMELQRIRRRIDAVLAQTGDNKAQNKVIMTLQKDYASKLKNLQVLISKFFLKKTAVMQIKKDIQKKEQQCQ